MKLLNLNNLVAIALWTVMAFTIYSTISALYVLNTTNIKSIIGG
jgi:hypothetical protein